MFKDIVTDIFFDLDHTLWDFEKNSGLTFRKILSENAIAVSPEVFLKTYMPVNLEFWKLYREDRITQDELRFQRLRKTFDLLKVPVSNEHIGILSVQYIEHLTTFSHLIPDTLEVLQYLSPNYQLHIITNGFHQVQDRKLRGSGIADFFRVVINSEKAGVKKPNPHIFQLALREAGVSPERALMIGDSLEADILGARAVGFHTLFFNCNGEETSPEELTINTLLEIKRYL